MGGRAPGFGVPVLGYLALFGLVAGQHIMAGQDVMLEAMWQREMAHLLALMQKREKEEESRLPQSL